MCVCVCPSWLWCEHCERRCAGQEATWLCGCEVEGSACWRVLRCMIRSRCCDSFQALVLHPMPEYSSAATRSYRARSRPSGFGSPTASASRLSLPRHPPSSRSPCCSVEDGKRRRVARRRRGGFLSSRWLVVWWKGRKRGMLHAGDEREEGGWSLERRRGREGEGEWEWE